jgi:hypothetical protein
LLECSRASVSIILLVAGQLSNEPGNGASASNVSSSEILTRRATAFYKCMLSGDWPLSEFLGGPKAQSEIARAIGPGIVLRPIVPSPNGAHSERPVGAWMASLRASQGLRPWLFQIGPLAHKEPHVHRFPMLSACVCIMLPGRGASTAARNPQAHGSLDRIDHCAEEGREKA